MKKFVASTILAASILTPTIVAAEANYPINVFAEKKVEIRKGATNTYEAIATINNGKEVKVIDEFTNTFGEKWYRIDLGKNKIGWGPATQFSTKSTVTFQNAPLRKGATNSYKIVEQLKKGQTVKVLSSFTNTYGEDWKRVDANGKIGWVLGNQLSTKAVAEKPAVKPTPPASKDKVSSIPIRRGATSSYEIVGYVNTKQNITVLSHFTNASGELWYRTSSGGKLGWVLANDLQKAKTKITMNVLNTTNVRKGATSSYAVVGSIKAKQNVVVIDSFKNTFGEIWYRVDLNSVLGWVPETAFNSKAVKPKPVVPKPEPKPDPAPETPKPEPDPAPTKPVEIKSMYTITSSVPLKKGATNSYDTVLLLTKNQKVKVIDTFVNASKETWYRLEISKTELGWVRSDFLQQNKLLNKKIFIKENNTPIRSNVSTEAATLSTLQKGKEQIAIDVMKDSNGQTWFKVFINNKIGWIAGNDISETPTLSYVNKKVRVATNNTYLYRGATFAYEIKETLKYNTELNVLAEFINANNEKWYQVASPSKRTGWVPSWEIVESIQDIKYVYANKQSSLRKGAATNYAVAKKLQPNDQLIYLRTLNNWLNVETKDGVRGWILKNDISESSLTKLVSPTYKKIDGQNHVVWTKPYNFNLTYQVLDNNQLKLVGDMTQIELPSGKMTGIKSFRTIKEKSQSQSLIIEFQPGYTFTLRNYADKVTIKVVETGLKGKKIVIDPGHGGQDPGAIGYSGLKEKIVNLETATLLKKELEKAGAVVLLTRSTDHFLELFERTDIANNSYYDAFISIHANSFSSTSKGTETFFNSNQNFNGPKSETLSNSIQKHLVNQLGTSNRGVKDNSLYVNRMNALPSILVELAFLSNPKEEALMKTKEFRQKAAIGIAKGLEEYFSSF